MYHKSVSCSPGSDEERLKKELHKAYTEFVSKRERTAHQQIRRLFKHNIFNLQLPGQSILQQDLFSAKTWQFLGLTANQLTMAGAISCSISCLTALCSITAMSSTGPMAAGITRRL